MAMATAAFKQVVTSCTYTCVRIYSLLVSEGTEQPYTVLTTTTAIVWYNGGWTVNNNSQ